MNPNITNIIEQYLNNELSESEKKLFEQKMNENDTLRKEVDFQRQIHQAAKRISIKADIKNTAKTYHLLRKLILVGIVSFSLVIGTGIFYLIKNAKSNKEISKTEQQALTNILDKQAEIEHLPTNYFQWQGNDTVFKSPKGVLLSVPKNAFLQNGRPYNEPLVLQFQEAIDVQDIVKSGLSTMSGDKLLETQGMFGIKAFTLDNKRLDVNPKVGVYMQVPVDQVKEGMLLFEGKKTKNGMIDWQNPKKLEKLPTLADMNILNFYPPNYEDTLNKLKLRGDKKYRDSLYLSLEEVTEHKVELKVNGNKISPMKQKNKKVIQKDSLIMGIETINIKTNVRHKQKFYPINFYFDTFFVNNNLEINFFIQSDDFNIKGINKLTYRKELRIYKDEAYNISSGLKIINAECAFFKLNLQNINTIFDISFSLLLNKKNENEIFEHRFLNSLEIVKQKNIRQVNKPATIPPSKVLAFWKPTFNNTNLATRDFEKRMQTIHGTCDPKVLEVYTKNLNTSLSELDARVVKMGYPQFQKFADEQIGKVEISNPHLELISKYYEKEVENLKEQVKAIESIRLKKEQSWDDEVQNERDKENSRTNNRTAKNYAEEYEHNMNSVYKQLGKKRPPVVAFTITSNAAVYNIDRFVAEQTTSRTSGTFYDKETKKTAKLEYKPMRLKVAQFKKFQRLFVYLFPDKINSYHRIDGVNGNYSYNLNGEFTYDLAIVGYDERGYHFYSKKFIKGEDLGEITLQFISETKLNASLEQLNATRIAKPDDITSEIKWILKEKENYQVQKLRIEKARFRQRISRVVFPCADVGQEYAAESDSLNIEL